jgi:mono/diheme cytochrome c family protein
MKKILLGVLALVVLVVGGGAAFLSMKSPAQRPAADLKAEPTPERLERGRYLAENVSSCMWCHSPGDKTKWAAPFTEETKGSGGECWLKEAGFPGNLCAGNITAHPEHGLGKWTDGEIARAIREGVDNHGQAIFSIMPYTNYRHMSDEDVLALVAYLRTLPPSDKKTRETELDFPLSVAVKFMPQPLSGPVPAPDKNDKLAYGRYLVNIANCERCHTPVDDQHNPVPGKAFSGGYRFNLSKTAVVVSSNLTPHETGLGGRTRENFIAMFKAYASPESHNVPVAPEKNTVMPWLKMSGMTEEDLGAIYDYLRTVTPIENKVEKFPPT